MRSLGINVARGWSAMGPRLLPFADAASRELPMARLLRLALFQVSVGMAVVLLTGTLNRVMVVELGVPVWLVSLMVSLPLVFAPLRALVGFKSDHHRSVLGWRRVPYIWLGTLLQFGGLAIMPFALLVLSGAGNAQAWPVWMGQAGAALAFLLTGAGLHVTQTAGLALATDLAPRDSRPRVVALLYVMLLVGMLGSSATFALLLDNFSQMRLIQVIQGAALLTMVLNLVALWKQEARNPALTAADRPRPTFTKSWQQFRQAGGSARLLVAVGLGTAGFSMQDILLEPYGGAILGLSVSATTGLTALFALGMLSAFALASRRLSRGADPARLAAAGVVIGIFAFAAVIFSAALDSAWLFRLGALHIGFGGGLFAVGTLILAMHLADGSQSGLVLGAWGAVQATAAGCAIAVGGAVSDLFSGLAAAGALGPALAGPATGYNVVYHAEIAILFATLVALGPLVRKPGESRQRSTGGSPFGVAGFPG